MSRQRQRKYSELERIDFRKISAILKRKLKNRIRINILYCYNYDFSCCLERVEIALKSRSHV